MAAVNGKGYRVVAVSLYRDEAEEADRLTEILKRTGWHKANRSLVVREALARLQEELAERSPEEIFRYFIDRHAVRAAAPRRSALSQTVDAGSRNSAKH